MPADRVAGIAVSVFPRVFREGGNVSRAYPITRGSHVARPGSHSRMNTASM
jgi:hypothetical protein